MELTRDVSELYKRVIKLERVSRTVDRILTECMSDGDLVRLSTCAIGRAEEDGLLHLADRAKNLRAERVETGDTRE